MSKLKTYLRTSPYGQCSLFLCVTAGLLYILYQIIQHLPLLLTGLWHGGKEICAAFSPLFIGLIIAYLLSPLVASAEKKMPRPLAIAVTFLGIFLSFFLLFYSLALLILGQLSFYSPTELLANLLHYFTQYEETISSIITRLPTTLFSEGLERTLNGFLSGFSDRINAMAAVDFAKNIGGTIINFILGIVVSFYLLKDHLFFKRLWRKLLHLLLPLKQSARVKEFLLDVDGVISRFLRGQLLDGGIVAIISSLGLSLIGLEFAVFVGLFAGICNIIPYFGPVLGMIPAVMIAVSTDGLWKAVLSVLVLFFIQQVDSTVISPKVVGSSIGLHPVFVLLSVTAGGYFWGILGMLIAVPIAAIIKLFVLKALNNLQ